MIGTENSTQRYLALTRLTCQYSNWPRRPSILTFAFNKHQRGFGFWVNWEYTKLMIRNCLEYLCYNLMNLCLEKRLNLAKAKTNSIPVHGSMWSDLVFYVRRTARGESRMSWKLQNQETVASSNQVCRDSWGRCRCQWCQPQSCRSGSWSSSWEWTTRSVLFGFRHKGARMRDAKIEQTGNSELRVWL